MSLYALNRALLSQTLVWRRLLVIVAAIVAIVGGLLAMHSFSTHTDHSASVVAADVAHELGAAHAGEASTHAAQHECTDAGCQPGHSAEVTACLLALLVATIFLVIRDIPGRTLRLLIVALARRRRVAEVRAPRPPSLVALCISRT